MSATIYRTLISLVTLLYFSATISAQTTNSLLGKWKGTMSPPDTKMEVDATVSFISIDQISVSVKKLLISKTIYFIRTS